MIDSLPPSSPLWCRLVTLDDVRDRCEIVGDCWEWAGAYCGPRPVMKWRNVRTTVRRVVYALTRAQPARDNAVVGVTCGNPRCVNPDHLAQRSHQLNCQIAARAAGFGGVAHAAKIAAGKQRVSTVMTMERAREIRAATGTQQELAHRYGVSRALISLIRRHQAWREVAGNPFAQLMR